MVGRARRAKDQRRDVRVSGSKHCLISASLACVGLALLVVGLNVSNAAMALVPGLVLIVVGFTVPVFIEHREDS